ncbi:hypothetical protein BDN72DRAFT_676134 [Pluteus cervinus]|uniref:Uncharacterized protein n=1 Tax=Pluteus cervinus TaxID=181527 RepID=A0ACD3ARZ1_9AGAR|nr:hypothetical protein BDN72DRAFT_676134 [Pluteus cervinus]
MHCGGGGMVVEEGFMRLRVRFTCVYNLPLDSFTAIRLSRLESSLLRVSCSIRILNSGTSLSIVPMQNTELSLNHHRPTNTAFQNFERSLSRTLALPAPSRYSPTPPRFSRQLDIQLVVDGGWAWLLVRRTPRLAQSQPLSAYIAYKRGDDRRHHASGRREAQLRGKFIFTH